MAAGPGPKLTNSAKQTWHNKDVHQSTRTDVSSNVASPRVLGDVTRYAPENNVNPLSAHPIAYFNEWLAEPIDRTDDSVAAVIELLNRHPMMDDETAQDYVMPLSRCREFDGRYRIYGESQDMYYCFVYEGDEAKSDPPVYFETDLDLVEDLDVDEADIIDDDHTLVADRFSDFIWQMLGRYVVLRTESGGLFSDNVSGVVFDEPIKLDDSFVNPTGRKFPAGFTCYFSNDVICAPDWGAAFRCAPAAELFISRYSPKVSRKWA